MLPLHHRPIRHCRDLNPDTKKIGYWLFSRQLPYQLGLQWHEKTPLVNLITGGGIQKEYSKRQFCFNIPLFEFTTKPPVWILQREMLLL